MSGREMDLDDEETKPSRPGYPVDWRRVLRAISRGKWWLLIAAAVGGLIGVVIGKFVMQHTYEASTSLRYEGLPGDDFQEPQRALPALVAVTHTDPIMIELRARTDKDGATLDLMRRMVQVTSDAQSGLVTFTTTGGTAEESADMANTLVDVFLEHHRERRSAELRAEMASLDERIAASENEAATARRAYDSFREANGITDLTAEQEQAIDQAAELRSQADLAQAEIMALEARVRQLTEARERTPRMETVSTSSGGSSRLRELQARLAEARGQGMSEQHPTVQALQRQISALRSSGGGGGGSRTARSSLYEQIETSLSEAETELSAARERHNSLEQLAGTAQERTNRFSAMEGQAANLLAQVNVKQALVNELNEQRAGIEDQLRDIETGFRTVAEARPPESAVPSKKKYAVAGGIPLLFVTVMLGMLLYRELRGLRVITPTEVAWWGNGPVIGMTTWPRDPRALIDLIADMDDFAPDARGTMLVVGATDSEQELASEIAGQLNHDWSSTTLIDVPVVGALPPGDDPAPMTTPSSSRGHHDVYDDDEVLSGEIHDGPTEIVLAGSPADTLAMGAPSYAPPPRPISDDPADRLICTAWNGPPEGQALRRAARLAERVLVVVTSGNIKATDLAQTQSRLGRDGAIGYVLVGASESTAKLPDREGPVEHFWAPSPSLR